MRLSKLDIDLLKSQIKSKGECVCDDWDCRYCPIQRYVGYETECDEEFVYSTASKIMKIYSYTSMLKDIYD